mmetsp:Transcript_5196/g.9380  ORF Transcript_5196/g.9380 Transcript_5196/m.9380 type:complete len:85 (+) Transcript_5196:721-975(+)
MSPLSGACGPRWEDKPALCTHVAEEGTLPVGVPWDPGARATGREDRDLILGHPFQERAAQDLSVEVVGYLVKGNEPVVRQEPLH